MTISSDSTSALPSHTKSMSISNITTPSPSNEIYFENTPLSSAVNPSLSVTSSPSISSHEKESRTSQSPEYMLYSSYEEHDTQFPPEMKPKINRRIEKRGFQSVTSQLFHGEQEYEKTMFSQHNNRRKSSLMNYTTTTNIQTKFNQGSEYTISAVYPLSQHERRQRNKVASAKYRAKKNQQYGEMRSLISSLTKENELLKRQLNNVKRENDRLKGNCDRLRGKLVAEKMLKKFLCQKKHHTDTSLKDDVKIDQKC